MKNAVAEMDDGTKIERHVYQGIRGGWTMGYVVVLVSGELRTFRRLRDAVAFAMANEGK